MSRRRDPPWSGLLLLDKPEGMTSHDLVAWVRRTLGMRRVGHAGTLDPLACGLLPCFVGPSTRLVQYLHSWSKNYVGRITLGQETSTGDREGLDADAERNLAPLPPPEVLRQARERLTGSYLQTPPVYSAKKIGGVPAHRLARQGHAPVMTGSRITVHALRLSPRGESELAFAARVSSGTYIRSLARDLGRLVGTGAYLSHLRRTAIGPLVVRAALPPDHRTSREDLLSHCIPPANVPLPLPRVCLSAETVALFRAGRKIEQPTGAEAADPGPCAVVSEAGLVGIGERDDDGGLQPRVVLPTQEGSGP